jgi:uncharacterized protein YejL (UPF0352 family)
MLSTTALVALMGAAPAFAQTDYSTPQYAYPGERIYVPAVRSGSPIHGGWVAPGDDQLLNDVTAALQADRTMNGLNVTIVAKNGELIINGVAQNVAQAARVDRIAKRFAPGRVTSTFDTQGG